MDRNLQPRYNLRSFDQNLPPANASEPSLPSSASISSEQLHASKPLSMMMMPPQLQPNVPPNSQTTALLATAANNEPRPLWAHPNQSSMAGPHNLNVSQNHHETAAPAAGAYQHAENNNNNNNLGGPSATAPFLRDFTLVAEAVKRVQMEVVMNEMESIRL
jgi:hypothetical protein